MIVKLDPQQFKYDLEQKHYLEQINSLIASHENVVLKFQATWCGPCRALSNVVRNIDSEKNDLLFIEVDVDQFDRIASLYNVSSIPMLYFYKNGKKAFLKDQDGKAGDNIFLGSLPEDEFVSLLEETFNITLEY